MIQFAEILGVIFEKIPKLSSGVFPVEECFFKLILAILFTLLKKVLKKYRRILYKNGS